MKAALARWAYDALLWAISPLYRLRLWRRGGAEPLYRHAIAERFGRGYAATGPRNAVWVHAVSLGETHAAAALVGALRESRPGVRLLLTHGTATGREAGLALLQPGDAQCWLPYDTPGAVRRFLDHWQPAVGVLMETEVWPNLIRGAVRRGLPMLLVNARLSARSLKRGQRFAALLMPAMAALSRVMAQTEADAQRLRTAGARRVEVAGNLKFDATPDAALLDRGRAWAAADARPLVLAASTREGEEGELLAAWRAAAPPARLLLVPRHPQRFDDVAAMVERGGWSLSRRSAWPATGPDAQALAAEVWLGDSMGELPAYYAASRVALLGGSFAPLGGQNLIEAAACGCPVLMGPHTFNFAEAAERSVAAGAGERVEDLPAAVQRAGELAGDDAAHARMAARALDFAAAHRGAARRMAAAIVEEIGR